MGHDRPGPTRDLIRDCIHCGLCLPACPTYRTLGTEADSPRGRLYLLRAFSEGTLEPTPIATGHLDGCLVCRACEPACPSGVRFGTLMESSREAMERHRSPWSRALRALLLDGLLARPERIRPLAALLALWQRTGLSARFRRSTLAARIMPRLVAAEGLLPPLEGRWGSGHLPPHTAARGERRGRVLLLSGCAARYLFHGINRLTVEVLAHHGFEVEVPSGQPCCGAVHVHAGRRDTARTLARAWIDLLERSGADHLVANAAGCGATLKEVGALLADDPAWAERARTFSSQVRDLLELLWETGPMPMTGRVEARLAYHDACHLAHVQGIREAPRRLLAQVPGLDLRPLADADRCCGSAGIYNLTHPEMAERLLGDKLDRIERTGAEFVAAANPGCLIQLAAGLAARGGRTRAVHPVEVLARAWSIGSGAPGA